MFNIWIVDVKTIQIIVMADKIYLNDYIFWKTVNNSGH